MQSLGNKLAQVEMLAKLSKLRRLLHHPMKYVLAVGYRTIVYPWIKKGMPVKATTFFDSEMHLMLPAATDIYLTGGKADPSEIRLAKFMIQNLSEAACFFDVGAHFGYYTLLAVKLVGESGVVCSFEPSSTNFKLLQQNAASKRNIHLYNAAVSDTTEELLFYEFPVLFSEFNTTDIDQFEEEAWLSKYQPEIKKVSSIVLDQLIEERRYKPSMIKIDVEGGELNVINGLVNYIAANNCVLIMEYLSEARKNEPHQKAVTLLQQSGFTAFAITEDGSVKKLDDVNAYVASLQSESENIVFKK
ncbi:FkbM family methyltransferase [Lacibacter sp. H375]|uniref:FkbM family methyltransferase n=1 Tax=Lacibacter sp. H375 TaxID=3133424 RepID=UPI0030C54D36